MFIIASDTLALDDIGDIEIINTQLNVLEKNEMTHESQHPTNTAVNIIAETGN